MLNLEAIRGAGIRIGVDPLGGSGVAYWEPIADRYGLNLTVVNPAVDPTFRFMPLDWDGKIRMDCSSPFAMAGLIAMRDRFDVAFGNDTDADRHGIVTRTAGLLNPNHYLAVAIDYLFRNRAGWRSDAGIGKTVVSSGMIDRVAARLSRRLFEVPVGFKWFVQGLSDGTLGFGGEESAGASFLREDGTAWSTDKDGLLLGLLAAEMMATTGRDPGEHYADLTREFGAPVYERIDAPATKEQKAALSALSPSQVTANDAGGGADRVDAHDRPRERRRDRGAEGGHRERMVRRPPLGDGGRLQIVRGELPRSGPLAADPGGGEGSRRGSSLFVGNAILRGWGIPEGARRHLRGHRPAMH